MAAGQPTIGVVGAGIIGLSTAVALDRRGYRVRLFDRSEAGQAQSGGLTRVFRHIHSDERLIALAKSALRLWHDLERDAQTTFLDPTGVLLVGNESAPTVAAQLRNADVEYEFGSVSDLAVNSLPPFASSSEAAVLDKDGGSLRSQAAVRYLRSQLRAPVIHGEVFAVAPSASGVAIHTADGAVGVDRAVICAGTGTRALARQVGVDVPDHHAVHLRGTFRLREGGVSCACLLDRSGRYGEAVYGSWIAESSEFAIGLSGDDNAVPLDGDDDGAGGVASALGALEARLIRYVRAALPGLDPDLSAVRLCTQTPLTTSSDAFRAWIRDRIVIFAGHNVFKFAPLIGDLLADSIDRGVIPDSLMIDVEN